MGIGGARGAVLERTRTDPPCRHRVDGRDYVGKAQSEPRRSRLLVVLLVSALTASIATALGLTLSAGSVPAPSVPTAPRPVGYQVLYQTDTNPAGQSLQQWQLLTVDRPFQAAELTYDEPVGLGVKPVSGYVSSEQALYDVSSQGIQLVSDKEPGVPSGDEDLITQMPEMLARGVAAETRGIRRIAGHTCTVYRLAQPPAGAISPLDTGGDHDDVCLEANGIILSEAWTYHAHLVYSRHALKVTLANSALPSVNGGTSAPSPLAPALTPDPSPSSFLAPPPAPPGFRAVGTYHYSVPNEQDPALTQASSVVWAFVNGPDVVTVEAGRTAGGALPWEGENTVVERVGLPGFANARSAIRSDGAEIRIAAGHGEWVRVRGTVPISWLTRYARSLRMAQ